MNRGQRRGPPSGNVLMDQGRFEEAADAYKNALAQKPDDAAACNNLGVALDRLGKYGEAAEAYRRAVALKPDYAEAHYNLGVALMKQGKPAEAAAQLEQALAIKPDYAAARNNLGNILVLQNRPEEAVLQYQRALEIKPDYEEAGNNLGNAYAELGRLEESVAAYSLALAIRPDFAEAHYNLSAKKTYTAGDPQLKTLEAMARKAASLTPKAQMNMWFALGKAREDVGRHDDAFAAYEAGNKLKRATFEYDEDKADAAIDDIIHRYDRAFAAKKKGWLPGAAGCADTAPVFIIGMPRSGTTLIEQILASHTKVHGGGELPFLPEIVSSITALPAGASYMDWLLGTNNGALRKTGEAYLQKIRALDGKALRICDKLPRNFLYAGLIHKILPHARIIHAVRDPLDTCLSLYALLFRQNLPYAYDLAELGRHYRRCQRLMDHWQNVLPQGKILEVRYEDVVADLPAQAHRMVEYCGLDWEESCLDFHKNSRPVRTASIAQVRRPLYQSAVGRWRSFEKHLEPLKKALGQQ